MSEARRCHAVRREVRQIFSTTPIKSVTVLRMEVPCCGGMTVIIREALKKPARTFLHRDVIG